jgi:DNA topoisomerase-2
MDITLKDMVNKELIHFSVYDNARSIPNYIDGLKPSQRKILYYMLKKNITENIKVAQLSGYVSAETSYHHGEVSLQKAIVCMAQNFIGANNINLLYPSGNFGTRPFGGSDASSARYIFTRLDKITKVVFNDKDSDLLKYLEDDGQTIEPEFFLPIIPMILVNGCEGIGTGYSTFIPCYSPLQIIDNLIYIIDNKGQVDDSSELTELIPYYKNFKGEIV